MVIKVKIMDWCLHCDRFYSEDVNEEVDKKTQANVIICSKCIRKAMKDYKEV